MTSDKQVQANHQNALKSTGPKTQEGKAAVRYNPMKHGLLSQDVLLPGEDQAALEELSELLREELQPVGELESLLVDRLIAAHWRLRRLGRVEAGIFVFGHYGELAKQARREADTYTLDTNLESSSPGLIYPHATLEPGIDLMDEEKHREATERARTLERMQEESDTATLGQSFVSDANEANAFSKLSRYETAIERSLYKALHELQRLQAARRAGGNVSPPAVLDVDVSGISREDL